MTTAQYVPSRPIRLSHGEMIRACREAQEMSQAELAKAAKLSQPTLSAIEHDRIKLGVDRAERLARALKVHPSVLLWSNWGRP